MKAVEVPLDFAAARTVQERLDAECQRTGAALRALSGGGARGLTPDHVKATPAWQDAKRASNAAFARLRNFNQVYVRRFRREIRAERRDRMRGAS